ncbi:autotransporter domain-containing protein [Nitrobacter sp.]|uniref:autotransporter domain-containing protein n=1 Tax=Nitrobacter sp. TaxID=29420 RepID=UPI0029CABDE0|nr:autotransporter domain-containing protein [Nitrobacter sp.]
MGHLTATAGNGRAARHRGSLCASTALATLFCAGLGLELGLELGLGPANAQTVTGSGDLNPAIPAPSLPTWTIPGDLVVGDAGVGTLTIAGGGTVSNTTNGIYGAGIVGSASTGNGTVTITGNGSAWIIGGATPSPSVNNLVLGYGGTGTLNILDGAKVSNAIGFVGHDALSNGTATVSGAGSTWTNSEQLQIGVYGTGTLDITAGGKVSNTAGVIGINAAATGTVTVSGADSTWKNSEGLYVGWLGAGTLTIADGGKVSALGVDLAAYAGSSGTINIGAAAGAAAAAAGTLDAASINFFDGTGTLNFNHTGAITLAAALSSTGNGTHALNHYAGTTTLTGDSSAFKGVTTVDGGTLEIAQGGKLGGSSGVIGGAIGTNGFATVTGAGSTWTPGELIVGEYGTGTLTIEDGGKVVSNGGDSIIAYHDTSNGHVTVSGVGSTWNTDRLLVGMAGQGTLLVEAGGYVSSSNAVVGFGNPGGSAMVTGTGSVWKVSGNIELGLFGTGTLTVADGGKVIARYVKLTQEAFAVGTVNIGAAPGSPAAAPGTLEAEKLRFSDGTGTLNFNHTGVITFTPALATLGYNTSTLNHYAGTTTLTGDSSDFWGTTKVLGGTLLVNNALGGVINVDAGGTLGGTGNLGLAGRAVTIAAGGIHAPGAAQTVLGNYVNQGTLRIEGNPAGANKVVVAGAVNITGATLDLVLSPANAASWNVFNGPFTIIDKRSAGVVTGTFNPVTKNLLFLDTRVAYDGGDGNDVTLQLIRNDLSFGSVGQTRNQRATGAAIDTLGSGNLLWRTIALNGDPNSVRASFDALSGEIHASAKTALIEDSRFVRNAINDRIRAAFAAPGASHAPALAYASIDTPMAVSPNHAGPVFWSYGFGSWGSTDSDGNAAALKRSTGGLLIGTDGFVGDWRIGLMTGYSHSRFNASDRFSSGDSDNYHFGAYGGTQWGSLSFRSGLAYTWHELDTRRAVAIPGFSDNLSTRYNAGTTQVFGELGYGMAAAGARFEPFANLAYVNLHTGDYAERGGTAALTGRSDTTGVTFTTAGLRAETDLPFWNTLTTLRGMLGWRHAFGDTIPTVTQAFAGSNAFTVAGVPIARDSAVLEAGLDFNVSPNATFGLAYEGQFASGADDQGFKANLAVKF